MSRAVRECPTPAVEKGPLLSCVSNFLLALRGWNGSLPCPISIPGGDRRSGHGCFRGAVWKVQLLSARVPAVPYKELRGKDGGVTSAEMRGRVEAARRLQQQRGFYNAQIPQPLLRKLCALDEAGERTLEMAVRRMGLSARAHDRILKVARTIADLARAESVSAKHLAEAVQYRSLDRTYLG